MTQQQKKHWTDLRIVDVRKQTDVTDLGERLRILRLFRQIGYANGFVVYDGDRPARVDGVSWIAFTWD